MSRAVDHVILTATALASPADCIIYAATTANNFERGGISLKKNKNKNKKTKSGIRHTPNMSEDQDLLSKISQLAGKLNDATFIYLCALAHLNCAFF